MLRSVEENRGGGARSAHWTSVDAWYTREGEIQSRGQRVDFPYWLSKNSYPYRKIWKLDFYLNTKIGFRWGILERGWWQQHGFSVSYFSHKSSPRNQIAGPKVHGFHLWNGEVFLQTLNYRWMGLTHHEPQNTNSICVGGRGKQQERGDP